MTEAEWLSSSDPSAMLRLLMGQSRQASHDADDEGSLHDEADARCRLCKRRLCDGPCRHVSDRKLRLFVQASRGCDDMTHAPYASWADFAARIAEAGNIFRQSVHPKHSPASLAALLREIVGNPFRPVTLKAEAGHLYRLAATFAPQSRVEGGRYVTTVSEHWDPTPWLTPAVLTLAQVAYEERLPDGTLDPARLAVLSDALEEAGCTDEVILSHLRSPGPHVRGCWAVDCALSKE